MKEFEISNDLELEIRRGFSHYLRRFRAQKKWVDDAIGEIVQHDPKLYRHIIRVKEISSVLTKINGKINDEIHRIDKGDLSKEDAKWMNARKYSDFEQLIDDWVGCRVIAYLHDAIIPLHKEIVKHARFKVVRVTIHDSKDSQKFSSIKIKKRRDERKFNDKGYNAIHYIIEPLPVDRCWDKEPKIFPKFELQIRTLLQEAWGEIQHAVIYKGRMPEFIKQERSDAFSGLAGFLFQCDIELSKLAKNPFIQKIVKPR